MPCCRCIYLWGISTGDFQEALAAILGEDSPNLSPSVIARLNPPYVRRVVAFG